MPPPLLCSWGLSQSGGQPHTLSVRVVLTDWPHHVGSAYQFSMASFKPLYLSSGTGKPSLEQGSGSQVFPA